MSNQLTTSPGVNGANNVSFSAPRGITKNDIEAELNKVANNFAQQPFKGPEKKEELSLDEILAKYKVEPTQFLEEPPVLIEIHGVKGVSTISTRGNFLAVIGKAKSRKTFLVTLLIAASVHRDILMSKIKALPDEKKNKVLLFDTEQSSYHVQKVLRRILHTAQVNECKELEVFSLRTLPPKLRLEAIKHKIYQTPNLALVVIDGIKDLVFDINDGKEATEITTELMKWSEETDSHIMVVLHQNKGDNNARGHLGTEVINKAETVISVAKDTNNTDLSVVTPEFCRDKEFEPFAFSVDKSGFPYIVEDWTPSESKNVKETINANNIPDTFHKDRLREIFAVQDKFRYPEFFKQIKSSFLPFYRSFGDNRAKDFISYYQSKKWIIKDEKPRYPTYELSMNSSV